MKVSAVVGAVCLLVAFLIPVLLPSSFEVQSAEGSSNETMNAVCYESAGESSVMQFRKDFPRPVPLPHQLLIEVHFASLNPCDYKWRRNQVPTFVLPKPKIPGADIAGVVVGLGAAVTATRFKIGDRVAAMMPILGSKWGAYAQFAAVAQDFVAHVPENVSLEKAAAVPLCALTAVQAFANIRGVTTNRTLLVQAGAGGVGSFAVQWAKHVLGMHVTATASGRNVDWLKSLGVDRVIDYTKEDFDTELSGLDVILDPMSYKYEKRTFASMVLKKPSGHYLNILGSDFSLGKSGFELANGIDTPWNWLTNKLKGAIGVSSYHYNVVTVNPDGDQLQKVFDEIAKGKIEVIVDKVLALERAAETMDILEKGHTRGKLVLRTENA